MTRKGFHDFAKDLDKFVVELFHSKWPLDKKTYLGQEKTVEDYKKHSLSSKNISLEDIIGIQHQRVVLSLED